MIASDVSKYELDSPGEATQGAAAVAMLVSADPPLVRVEGPSGLFTADVMDFWRPNYRATAAAGIRRAPSRTISSVSDPPTVDPAPSSAGAMVEGPFGAAGAASS